MIKKVFLFCTTEIPIHLIMLVTAILPNIGISNRIRGMLIRPFLGKCGRGLMVAKGVTLVKPGNMVVGDKVYLAHYVWINAVAGLEIGDEVIISPYCVIDTSKHQFKDGRVAHVGEFGKIKIGHGSWIAAHSIITLGVNILEGSLVGAGSVVTKDVDAKVMVGGVPAKFIKKMDNNKESS